MKSGKRIPKQLSTLLTRSSTPSINQKKTLLQKTKSAKGKKFHTGPRPSLNNSFTEELMEEIKKSLARPKKSSRNSSPLSKIKLSICIKIEAKLWEMIQNVNEPQNFNKLCKEYWEQIKTSKIWEIEDHFKEVKQRKSVRKALIIELCGVMISGELYQIEDSANNVKNLMLFIHQNYIEVLNLMYRKLKLPFSSFLGKMKEIIMDRRISSRSDKTPSLNQNSEILFGLLKEICNHLRQNSRHSALSTSISSILETVNKLKYVTVRDAISQALSLSDPILIRPQDPYLPPVPSGTFTLVLDLDETLVHFVQNEEEGIIKIRPGCEEFIKGASEWYELVIFTAGLQDVILY
jgi:NLI interacting factor-like phosphatase